MCRWLNIFIVIMNKIMKNLRRNQFYALTESSVGSSEKMLRCLCSQFSILCSKYVWDLMEIITIMFTQNVVIHCQLMRKHDSAWVIKINNSNKNFRRIWRFGRFINTNIIFDTNNERFFIYNSSNLSNPENVPSSIFVIGL